MFENLFEKGIEMSQPRLDLFRCPHDNIHRDVFGATKTRYRSAACCGTQFGIHNDEQI